MDPKATNQNGLSSTEAATRLKKYGENALPRARRSWVKKWVRYVVSPISLMLIAAAVLSFVLGKYFDGWFIVALFVLNVGISIWHERKADHALQMLEERVTSVVKTLRDGRWRSVDSRKLVPGDFIELSGGSVVPADAEVVLANSASANESALTGESLPVDKKKGDTLSMGSFIASGIVRACVGATGGHTKFGNVIARDSGERRRSVLEQDILTISKFLSGVAVVIAALLSVVLYFAGQPVLEIIRLDLSLLIAGIPVALPVVMSLIISVGVLRLSEKNAIVRRLEALEELANVDLLLSDKTGTLTKNKIKVHEVVLFDSHTKEEAAALAATTVAETVSSPLEQSILDYAQTLGVSAHTVRDFVPADSVRKRSTVNATVDGKERYITLGAPQVIETHAKIDAKTKRHFEKAVTNAAKRGYRALALAVQNKKVTPKNAEKSMELVAVFFLSDELREDASAVIKFLGKNGVSVKMLTGDNIAIAGEIAGELGLSGDVTHCKAHSTEDLPEEVFDATGVFAEVLPEDKENLVKLAQMHHTVAVTGDGVNDLPAVRIANVGVAVMNAVDALKSAADIVLTEAGISVIRDAVVESRKIFTRIYSYSVYRISESFRVIVTVAFFGALFFAPILTPLQLLMLAFLNDLPIVSLAFNRVREMHQPAKIDVKRRFSLSLLFGTVGIANSILFFFLARDVLHVPWDAIQTLFFLKLTVSGHMLVFVAHTEKRWYQFLPSRVVIVATITTQIVATGIALFGFLMTGVPFMLVVLVWFWAFFWMQVADLMKLVRRKVSQQ